MKVMLVVLIMTAVMSTSAPEEARSPTRIRRWWRRPEPGDDVLRDLFPRSAPDRRRCDRQTGADARTPARRGPGSRR
jgi:hypothetical protein